MKILILGGTRFFGIPMVNELIANGHDITIATRGRTSDSFTDHVHHIIFERSDEKSIQQNLCNQHYDVVIDKIAYCSNDVRHLLDHIDCDQYILMSSTSVYNPLHINTIEKDFDASQKKLIWCNREDANYSEVKQQAECALSQYYPNKKWISVRYPYVIGEDDYTKRLLFYVEHTMHHQPMFIDNLDHQMGFINSNEAGKFIAYLVNQSYQGPINGCSTGTISIHNILTYIEKKTGIKPIYDVDGDIAPYNETPEYSINTDIAQQLGYSFSSLNDWIYNLLDYYIATTKVE